MESIYDKDIDESDKKIRILYDKITNIEKAIDKERHLRELLIAEKCNRKVYMKPKY